MNQRTSSKPAYAISINDEWDFNTLKGLYQIFTQVSLDPGNPSELSHPDPHRFGRVERGDSCYSLHYRPSATELTIIFIVPNEARREYKITPHSIVRRKAVNDRIYRKEWKTFFTSIGDGENVAEWNVVYDEEPRQMRYLLNGKLPTTWSDFAEELVKAADTLFSSHQNATTYAVACTADRVRGRYGALGTIDDNALQILSRFNQVTIPSLFRKGGVEVNTESYRARYCELYAAIESAALTSPAATDRFIDSLVESFMSSHRRHAETNRSVGQFLDMVAEVGALVNHTKEPKQ